MTRPNPVEQKQYYQQSFDARFPFLGVYSGSFLPSFHALMALRMKLSVVV